MAGNLISRHSHNEPDPGAGADPQLVERARQTPDKMTDSEWRQLLSSVQYQVILIWTCDQCSSHNLMDGNGGRYYDILGG